MDNNSIVIVFRPNPGWTGRVNDWRVADRMTLAYDGAIGDLVFFVNSLDLSESEIPLLDFSVVLRIAIEDACRNGCASVEHTESERGFDIRCNADMITIIDWSTKGTAVVPLSLFRVAVYDASSVLLARVLEDMPSLGDNPEFKSWYNCELS